MTTLLTTLLACGPAKPPVAATAPPDMGAALPFPTAQSLDGRTVQVPDPEGRTVVLELIRSADW